MDLDKKREIDLTFWAPTESAAKRFVEACERNGMPPGMVLEPAPSEANQRWLIRCHIAASIIFMTTKENIVTFLLFADKYDCEYDGWGTAIVETAGKRRSKGTSAEKSIRCGRSFVTATFDATSKLVPFRLDGAGFMRCGFRYVEPQTGTMIWAAQT